MREVRFRALRMMFHGADMAAKRDADCNRQRDPRPISIFRHVADDLVERRVDETVELDLGYRPEATQRQAYGDADDGRLSERRVEHAVDSKRLLQAVCNTKDTAERADVLTKNQNLLVARQGVAERKVDGFGHRDGFHQVPSSEASNSSRSSMNEPGGRS